MWEIYKAQIQMVKHTRDKQIKNGIY
uniref:Uncharacterized protein n=1 Tax=Rhizophora mucronata TaxID=61149 RepID=A0A2P2QKK9_RHIMU